MHRITTCIIERLTARKDTTTYGKREQATFEKFDKLFTPAQKERIINAITNETLVQATLEFERERTRNDDGTFKVMPTNNILMDGFNGLRAVVSHYFRTHAHQLWVRKDGAKSKYARDAFRFCSVADTGTYPAETIEERERRERPAIIPPRTFKKPVPAFPDSIWMRSKFVKLQD